MVVYLGLLHGAFWNCQKERSASFPTDKHVHAHLAGNVMLYCTFILQTKPCIVVGWVRGHGSWEEDHQTAKYGNFHRVGSTERIRSRFTLYASVTEPCLKVSHTSSRYLQGCGDIQVSQKPTCTAP